MPTQRSPRTTTKTTPPSRPPANGGRKPTGTRTTRNGGNGISFWPVELVSSGPLDLTLEGRDGDDFGLAICGRCSAVVPGSDRARQAHARFHETVDAIDQRAG